jgi:hypothetical protein
MFLVSSIAPELRGRAMTALVVALALLAVSRL